jgi:hypothetical protein
MREIWCVGTVGCGEVESRFKKKMDSWILVIKGYPACVIRKQPITTRYNALTVELVKREDRAD